MPHGLQWYVARLKPGKESTALYGLEAQGFEPYYPQMQVTVARGGRVMDRNEAVFPCYAFLHSEPDPNRWRAANNTRGVGKLLGSGPDGIPSPLAEQEIISLREREQSGLLRHPSRRRIRQGDAVAFKCGSLVDQIGECLWTRRERVAVLLSFLGSSRTVLAPRDWLRVVAA